jgi:two-component system sensor histidine kinase KdpD
VSLLRRVGDEWSVEASAGLEPPSVPDAGTRTIAVADACLAISGAPPTGAEERLLSAFVAQLDALLERDRLAGEAAEAHGLAKADELRTALLRAVSHDLRSPLASIKATVSGLLADDVDWTDAQVGELLSSAYAETMRLDRVVADLLDAGRIQAGALKPRLVSVGLDEVVGAALMGIDRREFERITVEVPESLPMVQTDPSLLERVVENLIRNGLQHTPPTSGVVVDGGVVGGNRVDLRVVDRGPGIPASEVARVFQPFQRLEEAGTAGVGLGLAVAKGL